MSSPDLTQEIRGALLAESTVTDLLPAYQGSFPIFTRRPVPVDVTYPCLVISKNITVEDEDGVNDFRPIITRDIAAYHTNEPASNYQALDALADAVRAMFHRKRPFTIDGWGVTLITCRGPIEQRLEADKLTGRVVMLTVRVAQLAG